MDNLVEKQALTIGFLVNFSDAELELIRSLRKKEFALPIIKIDYSVIAKKRSEIYLKGGLFSEGIVTMTFDFLNKKVLPLEIVTNLIINNIEDIKCYKGYYLKKKIRFLLKFDNNFKIIYYFIYYKNIIII